jgi:hypothetical protein
MLRASLLPLLSGVQRRPASYAILEYDEDETWTAPGVVVTAQETYARRSKAGHILCGQQDDQGRRVCDGVVAGTVPEPRPIGSPLHRLVPPEGWRLDERKGIWHQTTELQDRRAHGRPRRPPPPALRCYPFLPTLVRCPKCRAVQWLDPAHLDDNQGLA